MKELPVYCYCLRSPAARVPLHICQPPRPCGADTEFTHTLTHNRLGSPSSTYPVKPIGGTIPHPPPRGESPWGGRLSTRGGGIHSSACRSLLSPHSSPLNDVNSVPDYLSTARYIEHNHTLSTTQAQWAFAVERLCEPFGSTDVAISASIRLKSRPARMDR